MLVGAIFEKKNRFQTAGIVSLYEEWLGATSSCQNLLFPCQIAAEK